MTALTTFFEQVIAVLTSYRPVQDTLDILIVTLIIFELFKLIRKTRSVQILKGLALLFVVYVVVLILDMPVMKFLFESVISSALVIIIILFSPEIRSVLERIGRSSIFRFLSQRGNAVASFVKPINSICAACSEMSDDKVGALIVFERNSLLGEVMKTGTKINADISSSLVRNIFYPKSPLHDGAMIVSGGRAAFAGCILPLTDTRNLDAKFGTRHRAAVGMTEHSDAVVVVVSEETGAISFVENGRITHDITSGELREKLLQAIEPGVLEEKKSLFPALKQKKGGEKHE